MAKKKRALDPAKARREFLALHPMRNPEIEWREHENRVVLTIKIAKNWRVKLLNIFFPVPETRDVVLDAIGTDVWKMADGQTAISQMSQKLGGKYKLGSRETELSLQQFFKDLGKRGYIGFVTEKKAVKSAE